MVSLGKVAPLSPKGLLVVSGCVFVATLFLQGGHVRPMLNPTGSYKDKGTLLNHHESNATGAMGI